MTNLLPKPHQIASRRRAGRRREPHTGRARRVCQPCCRAVMGL